MSFIQLDLTAQARGDTWNLEFLMQDSAGAAIDITGNQYWFTLKSLVELTDPAAELQYGPIAVSGANAPLGRVVMSIPPGLTDSLVPATYNYDLQEVSNTGVINTLLIGKVRVKADVTRTADYSGSSAIISSSAGKLLYSAETTSTATTEIFQGGILNSRYSMLDEGVFSFDALIIGRDNTTGESCAFQLYGALKKDLTTTQVIGSIGKNILGKDNSAFDADITADDANDSIKLEVTAATTNPTKWAAEIQYTEVSF